MGTLFVNGVETEDTWVTIDGEAPVPEGVNVIVSKQFFDENKRALLTRNSGRLGVHLEPLDRLEEVADYLDSLTLVSLDFPSFADGTSFSKARLLRDRYEFGGEVRAVGDVRIDQVAFLKRCGVDAMVITHAPTLDALKRGDDPSISLYYQPALGDAASLQGKSWARRSV